jgi:peptidyl-prolyl cis-trans isomerase C
MAQASARHILVSTEAKANELKTAIENGADFAQLAKENSSCPSSRDGGNLGTFGPGQMVKEFDTVVFSAPVGVVQGPVKTQFGYSSSLKESRRQATGGGFLYGSRIWAAALRQSTNAVNPALSRRPLRVTMA